MTRAYVNDISQFLDITNKENVKILKGKTLIWWQWYHQNDLNSSIIHFLPMFASILS